MVPAVRQHRDPDGSPEQQCGEVERVHAETYFPLGQ
jgi:hypothetical protein